MTESDTQRQTTLPNIMMTTERSETEPKEAFEDTAEEIEIQK